MNPKLLFLILPSYTDVYAESKIRIAVPKLPLLSIALLAAKAKKYTDQVKIIDLSLSPDFQNILRSALLTYQPDYCLYGFTTPLYREAYEIAKFIKEIRPQTRIVCGGVHPSLFPEDIVQSFPVDYVCVGEGEDFIDRYFQGGSPADIAGLAYRDDGGIVVNPENRRINELDDLPFPAWEMFDFDKYFYPRINVRKPPALPIMTSRGCGYKCSFCTKTIHGSHYRKMSPERVIQEIKYIKAIGANEFHVWDDQFSTDLNRAKKIAELLIRNEINMPWNLFIGVRVDSVDKEFLSLAKRSGLYQVAFAPESGNQCILDEIHKNIDLDQSIRAFDLCRKLNIETVGFFVFGFLNETQHTIKKTIDFAARLNADYAKVTIALPLPKTEFFEKLKSMGLIQSYDWEKYNFHAKHEVWRHPNLSWDELYSAYKLFYRKYYSRPAYLIKAFKRALRNKTFWSDLYGAVQVFK